jgi:hypothetical protein
MVITLVTKRGAQTERSRKMRNKKTKTKVHSSPDAEEWSSHEEDDMSVTCQHTREVNYNSLAENME